MWAIKKKIRFYMFVAWADPNKIPTTIYEVLSGAVRRSLDVSAIAIRSSQVRLSMFAVQRVILIKR